MSFLTVEKPYRSFYRIQRILDVNIFSNGVNPFAVLEGRSLPVSTYDNYNGRHLLLFPCDAECNFPRYYACLLASDIGRLLGREWVQKRYMRKRYLANIHFPFL